MSNYSVGVSLVKRKQPAGAGGRQRVLNPVSPVCEAELPVCAKE